MAEKTRAESYSPFRTGHDRQIGEPHGTRGYELPLNLGETLELSARSPIPTSPPASP
jgi:hypothetical protein